jgi:signal transduction histidine kinase
MTLRRKITLRAAGVVALCLLLLGGLAWHELVNEPRMRREAGVPETPAHRRAEYVEIVFYALIPVVLAWNWRLMRKTLSPLDNLARAVERIEADKLHEPLPRTFQRDEVDRLTEGFNAVTARLHASFQQIREFTLHASHELKTPLTVMRVQLETRLQDAPSLSPADVEWLECELHEVIRLSHIVDSLTLLTKGEAGQVKLERQPVRLDELVRESFDDAQILAEPQNVTVTLGECEPVEFSGDRHRLRQLLLNLTDNAVKYNRPGGSVVMALRRRDGAAEIEITNTGEGIPPELQPRVFERFVRGDEARSRAIEGCGLGLTICRWIVQAHGGTIRLATDAAKRTTATVRLPLA